MHSLLVLYDYVGSCHSEHDGQNRIKGGQNWYIYPTRFQEYFPKVLTQSE